MTFIHPDSVVNGFESLGEEFGDEYDRVLDYFEETYIGMMNIIVNIKNIFHLFLGKLRSARVRRKPLFDIRFWSMHDRTTQSLMRTNNSAEAYHRRINSIFQCAHPTLWLFLQKLIDEENVMHADIVQINAGEAAKKKKLNERLEKRLINLLKSPHDDLSLQIDSVAHNIRL